MTRIGIIDLGSNSSRLVVYDINRQGAYTPIFRTKKSIQLARCITSEGDLSQEGLERALVTAKMFQHMGLQFQVERWLAVATAAMRQVGNGAAVLDAMERETGIHFRLLSGEQEAWYDYLGVINTMDVQDVLLTDIGGASTEIMLVRNRQLLHSASLPLGALTLAKRVESVEPSAQGQAARKLFEEQLVKVDWLDTCPSLPVIGIGGTMRALGKISSRMEHLGLRRFHGEQISVATLEKVYRAVQSSTVTQRRELWHLSESRSKVVHTGAAIAEALTHRVAATGLLVSGSGLREGLFYEYLLRDLPSPVLTNVAEHSVNNLLKLYVANPEISYKTADYAQRLFTDLSPFHLLQPRYLRVLRTAALLDRTGTSVNVEKYIRHTDYLMHSSHLFGMDADDLTAISQVVLGKGRKPIRQLNLMIRAAKFAVLEAGIGYEDLRAAIVAALTQRGIAASSPAAVYAREDMDFRTILKEFEEF